MYYLRNHIGSVAVVVDGSGNIVKESDYFPFGGEIAVSGSDPSRFLFTGKERDAESGLDFFEARHYGQAGRFMSADPLGVVSVSIDPQQLNRYAYARNNPLRFVDPTGLANKDAGEEIITVVGDRRNNSRIREEQQWAARQLNPSGNTAAGGLMRVICRAIPSGRTFGVSASVGGVGSVVGGLGPVSYALGFEGRLPPDLWRWSAAEQDAFRTGQRLGLAASGVAYLGVAAVAVGAEVLVPASGAALNAAQKAANSVSVSPSIVEMETWFVRNVSSGASQLYQKVSPMLNDGEKTNVMKSVVGDRWPF